jgi:hypothetical protein
MDAYELTSSSFIVKVWIEETKEEAGQTLWRGHITHVSSGARQYFEDLNKVTLFMIPYLQAMGIEINRASWTGE